jgi:hypothetical protein
VASTYFVRFDVDLERIAYVGHSFDGNCGAILDTMDNLWLFLFSWPILRRPGLGF